jgi:putative ABC transport system permease protein
MTQKAHRPPWLLNDRLAKKYFASEDPIGQRILIQEVVPGKTELGPKIAWQVVGVIADEKVNGLNDEHSAGVYVSNDQSPRYGMNLIVRTAVDPLALQKSITQAIHSVNKDQAISDIQTLERIKSDTVASNRLEVVLLIVFAAVALSLAAIGIYGVISYSVAQRTHELGIRAALGASGGNLLQLILYRDLVMTFVGILLGVGGAIALTRVMASLLYGVGARDPLTMSAVGVILCAVAFAACYVPARRATKVDPMIALRFE